LINARFRIVLGALLLQLPFGLVFAWGTVVPEAHLDGWRPLLTGAVFSATPLGYGVGTIVGGRLGDRLPPRRLCWTAIGLAAVGFLVAFALPSGLTFVVFYGFLALGVGGGLALTAGVAAFAGAFPDMRGLAAGTATATYAASSIVQAPVIGLLTPTVGWTHALAIVAAVTTALASVGVAGLPPLAASRMAAAASGSALTSLIRRPSVFTALLLVFTATTLGPAAAVNIGVAVSAHGQGAAIATAAITLLAIGNTAARLSTGWASDRFGAERPIAMLLIAELSAALLLYWADSALAFLVAAVAAGIALGAAGVIARIASESAPDAPSSAFGLVFAAYALAAVSSPLVAALAGLPAAWLIVGAPGLLGVALLIMRARLGHTAPERSETTLGG